MKYAKHKVCNEPHNCVDCVYDSLKRNQAPCRWCADTFELPNRNCYFQPKQSKSEEAIK